MKTNRKFYTAYALSFFLLVQSVIVYGQDDKGHKDLDFQIELLPDESEASDGVQLTNIKVSIESSKILNPKKIYVKVKSVAPREMYFIRAIEYEVFQGGIDVETWEREKAAQEKEQEKERIEKSNQPGNRRYKELWTAKWYEKQEGRSLKKVSMHSGDAALEFGPFSPGEYEVYVGIKDESSGMYIDTRKITITSESKQNL